MYLGYHDSNLGFDPVSAILTGFSFKEIFGIGKKKRAFKEMEVQAQGRWTSIYPSNIDWQEYLDKFGGAVRQVYEKERKRKDSMLLKEQIATPEDFAAYHASKYGLRGSTSGDKGSWQAHCNPDSRNPNSNAYKWCPVDQESGINVFDTPKLTAWYKEHKGTPPPTSNAAQSAPDKSPQPILTKTEAVTQFTPQTSEPGAIDKIITAITQQLPQNDPRFQQQFMPSPAYMPPAQPQEQKSPSWVIPAIIGVGIAGTVLIMQKKR